jgi:hypothetical protein
MIGDGMDRMQERFGEDLYAPEREADWMHMKAKYPPGTDVTGTVFARSPYGLWIDLGMGFPSLLEIIYLDHCPQGYPDDGSFAVGTQIAAKVLRFREGRVIYLRQKLPSVAADPGKVEFWCYSNLCLDEIFDRFRRGFPVNEDEFIHDAGNVWEWFEGKTADHLLAFNISRPHDHHSEDAGPILTEPIRFMLSLEALPMSVADIGSRLATTLGIEVRTGQVRYLGGNDFVYQVAQTFPAAKST